MSRYKLLIGLLAILPFVLFSQNTSRTLEERVNEYTLNHPRFKVFLHVDKPYYVPGDTVWYAGYAVVGPNHELDVLTGVLHVDMYNLSDGKPLVQQLVRLEKGHATGQITLSDSLPAGVYGLRAYTQFMRNFSEADFFQRRLVVYDPTKQPKVPDAASMQLADIQFFPEGGQLLVGALSRLAFKAVNGMGKGLQVRGCILTGVGDTVHHFSTDAYGFGYGFVQWSADQTYIAHVTDGQRTLTVPLPVVQKSGYTLSVDNLSNKTNVKIFVHGEPTAPDRPLTLLVHTRGRPVGKVSIQMQKNTQLIQLRRDQFPTGIVTATLFDAEERPISERLFFIGERLPLRVEGTNASSTYRPKSSVRTTLRIVTSDGQPVPNARLSLSVTDAGQVPIDSTSDHLLSYLLMSSDLRGQVEQPGRYFKANGDVDALAIDMLLLTQGWRQFVWTDVLRGHRDSLLFPLEKSLDLLGAVTRQSKKPVTKPVTLTFSFKPAGQQQRFFVGKTADNGLFRLDSLDFTDSAKLFIQTTMGENKRDFRVQLNQSEAAPFRNADFPQNAFSPPLHWLNESLDEAADWQAFLRKRRADNDILLKEIEIKAKKEDDPMADSRRNLYGTADNTLTITPDMTVGPMNPLQMLQGRVAGVQVNCSGTDCSVMIRGMSSLMGSNEPVFMIDGVTVSIDAITTLNSNDIEAIDVIKSGAMLGMNGAGGGINFLTKRSNTRYDYSQERAFGTNVFTLKGFSAARRFYVPRYDLVDAAERERPDRRPTVYWNGHVQTDASGNAVVTFFATDVVGKFNWQVQGLDATGKPFVGRGQYEVK